MKILGIGVDLCKSARIQQTYKEFSERFLARAFHPSEITEFGSRQASVEESARFLASRWAAKEAVYKAFSSKRLPFPEIEVVSGNATTAPRVLLHGEAKQEAANRGVQNIHLSLSHDGDYNIAFVILEGKE